MAKVRLAVFLILPLVIAENYNLKQVIILSRHNLRTPLSSTLPQITVQPWPHWQEKPGELTAKGAVLEGYMGKYFALWLQKESLLTNNSCPNEDTFFAYANNKQRTRASAEAFVDKAFPNCTVIVHHRSKSKPDPVFNPVVHNSSKIFKEIIEKDMNERMQEVNVTLSFSELQTILDYRNSENCREKQLCDLTKDKSKVDDIVVNEEPMVSGPLHIGNTAVDAFKMEYYEGFSNEEVAWGKITETEQWHELLLINRAYHDVRFNTTQLAHDIAKQLIAYIRNKFIHNFEEPKVTLLVGHDANLLTVLCALNFKQYVLNDQYESTPIGGKLVFQKWWDSVNGRDLLKVEYIYQSSAQLRDQIKLDLNNPPLRITMELSNCPIDENGFCPWDDFMKILKAF